MNIYKRLTGEENKNFKSMKKIMFNDKFYLTQEVLTGQKTMTRRFVKENTPLGNWDETAMHLSYKVGDIVAIAQSYKTIYAEMIENFAKHNYHTPREDAAENFKKEYENTAGWNNKMFVKADLLPHHIRITDVKLERLQDISEEDALREGVKELCSDYFLPNDYSKLFLSPRDAFAVLIDKVGKKGDWDKNPLVAAYTFELVD